MPEIQLLRGEEAVYARELGQSALYIGRASNNDLVLADPRVSSRHAVVWVEGDRVRVEDLGSRNGTFVNGQRLSGPGDIRDGDIVDLGNKVRLRLRGNPGTSRVFKAWLVEDGGAGVRHPVRSDRFRIGSDNTADLQYGDLEPIAVTLVVHGNGEVWLGDEEGDRELVADQDFVVGSHRFVLREAADSRTRTDALDSSPSVYRLEVTLQGATGPEAVIEDTRVGKSHRVTTDHRATLLYILARQVEADRAAGASENDTGWVSDDEVATGIWGREKARLEPNNYHVLLCRVRKELKDAGFDAWFIEKRRKFIRARLAEVRLH
jgi:hypothetical protein